MRIARCGASRVGRLNGRQEKNDRTAWSLSGIIEEFEVNQDARLEKSHVITVATGITDPD